MKVTVIFPEESNLNSIDLDLDVIPDVFAFSSIYTVPSDEYKYTNRYWKVKTKMACVSVPFKNEEELKEMSRRHLRESADVARLKYPHLNDHNIIEVMEVKEVPHTRLELYVVPCEKPWE